MTRRDETVERAVVGGEADPSIAAHGGQRYCSGTLCVGMSAGASRCDLAVLDPCAWSSSPNPSRARATTTCGGSPSSPRRPGFDGFFRSDHYVAMGGDGLPGPTDAWVTLAGAGRADIPDPARHAGHLGDVPPARPAGDQRGPGRRDERRPGRAGAGRRLVRGGAHRRTGSRSRRSASASTGSRSSSRSSTACGTAPGGATPSTGKHYQLRTRPALPKPVQSPRPPIIVGGAGKKRTPALAARFADEFNTPFAKLEDVAALVRPGPRPASAAIGRRRAPGLLGGGGPVRGPTTTRRCAAGRRRSAGTWRDARGGRSPARSSAPAGREVCSQRRSARLRRGRLGGAPATLVAAGSLVRWSPTDLTLTLRTWVAVPGAVAAPQHRLSGPASSWSCSGPRVAPGRPASTGLSAQRAGRAGVGPEPGRGQRIAQRRRVHRLAVGALDRHRARAPPTAPTAPAPARPRSTPPDRPRRTAASGRPVRRRAPGRRRPAPPARPPCDPARCPVAGDRSRRCRCPPPGPARAAPHRTGWPGRSRPAPRADVPARLASSAGSARARSRSTAPGTANCAAPSPSTK